MSTFNAPRKGWLKSLPRCLFASSRTLVIPYLAGIIGVCLAFGSPFGSNANAGIFGDIFSRGNDEVARMTREQQRAYDLAREASKKAVKRLRKAKERKARVEERLSTIKKELKNLQGKLALEKDARKRHALLAQIESLDGKAQKIADEFSRAQKELVVARAAWDQAQKTEAAAKQALDSAKKDAERVIAAKRKAAADKRKKEEAARMARERILTEEKVAKQMFRKAMRKERKARKAWAEAKERRDSAYQKWEQARAVALQRRRDLDNAKTPKARATAQQALDKAEQYAWELQKKWQTADERAQKAEKELSQCRAELEKARKRAQAAADAVAALKGTPKKKIRIPEPARTNTKVQKAVSRGKSAKVHKAPKRKQQISGKAGRTGGFFSNLFRTKKATRPKQHTKKARAAAPSAEAKRQTRKSSARKNRRPPDQKVYGSPRTAKPVLIPVRRIHQEKVSEPAPWAVPTEQSIPILPAQKKLTTPDAKGGNAAREEKTIQFDIAMVSGDKDIVEKLKVWKEWADYVPFNPVTIREINAFYGKLLKALQEQGYVFAKVTFPTRIWSTGIFLAKVDCGPLGTIVVRGNRHYSAKQIIRALQRQEGERFNYARIYGDLFDLNTKPDLKIDTKLKPLIQDGRRVINAELIVHDRLPIHASFEASNTGTKETNDWRLRTTVQHLNLTKHDDILTLDWLTSPDWHDVNAYSGSYFLPLGEKYSINLYGGYSKSNINDVMPQLDVRGKGYFYGGQITRTIKETMRYRWQLSAGWIFQHNQTHHDVSGASLDRREYDVSMPSLTLGYASRTFDKLGGRNFFSNTVMANFGGNFGSSSSAEFNAMGAGNSEGTFLIDRFQVARLQHFFRGEETPGKWSLFMKIEGQLASDTLVPELRKSVGGANTVRGYAEDDMAGDQALVATLELRTPLLQNFIPGLKKSDKYLAENPDAWQRHRLQFLLFTDVGVVDLKNPLPGEQDRDTMIGVGAGLRLGLTKYSQMRLDIGYPLEKTEESDNIRAHLSLQLQF